jgi:ribokinase
VSRIVVIGDVMVDVVVRLSGRLALGSDSPARNSLHGGGQAANTAAWLAAAGERPLLVGRVGDDVLGREAIRALRDGGVECRLALDPQRPTGTCVVLVSAGGERTMMPDAGANDALAPEDLPDELLDESAHLHVAGYALLRDGSRAAARSAIERARERGLSVSLDPSSAALLPRDFLDLAEGAGLLVPNAAEATALTGERDPERAARLLAERVGEVAVTLAAEGALWTDGDLLVRVAAEPAQLVDSTGAGDAFAAGLLAARTAGAEPREALAAACRLAAAAVATTGARPPFRRARTRAGDA